MLKYLANEPSKCLLAIWCGCAGKSGTCSFSFFFLKNLTCLQVSEQLGSTYSSRFFLRACLLLQDVGEQVYNRMIVVRSNQRKQLAGRCGIIIKVTVTLTTLFPYFIQCLVNSNSSWSCSVCYKFGHSCNITNRRVKANRQWASQGINFVYLSRK
jgi:hypothetical protein